MIKPDRIQIRMAKSEDEPRLAELVDFSGLPPVNWEGAHPNWIVAEVDEKIVGTIQIALSKPIGRVEFLRVDNKLTDRAKFSVSIALGGAAEYAIKSTGSSIAAAFVPFEQKGFKKLLKKYFSGKTIAQGNIILVGDTQWVS